MPDLSRRSVRRTPDQLEDVIVDADADADERRRAEILELFGEFGDHVDAYGDLYEGRGEAGVSVRKRRPVAAYFAERRAHQRRIVLERRRCASCGQEFAFTRYHLSLKLAGRHCSLRCAASRKPHYEHDGRRMALSAWCAEQGVPYYVAWDRLRRGWSFEKALNFAPGRQYKRWSPRGLIEHSGRRMTLIAWCALRGLKPNTARWRLRAGWSLKEAVGLVERGRSSRRKRGRAVECIETGQRYTSQVELARELGTHEATLRYAIQKGRPCKGLHYRRVAHA